MHLRRQAISFTAVGISWNAAAYIIFVVLTSLFKVDPKVAMSAMYWLGIGVSYGLNRNLTFRHGNSVLSSGWRFTLLYLFGYGANLFLLWVLVDHLRVMPWLAQGLIAVVLAVGFFFAQRLWVFK